MENNSGLKKSSINGFFWSFIQKFGVLLIAFFSNIFLVRLLTPEEFGVFGILMIFISFSDTFLDSGFGSSLIQKKDIKDIDYYSVFIFNLFLSLIIFTFFIFISDPIADYFENTELSILLKVQSIVILFNALCIVQNNQLQKEMNFKKLATISTIVAIFSNVLAVVLAYYGCSYWSLVIRNIVLSASNAFLLWYLSTWRPKLKFSFNSLKSLFSFGGYMFVSAIVEKIYLNIQSFIIGKHYSLVQLGYYSQASRLQEIPANTISQVINQVTYPLYSNINDDLKKLKSIFILNAKLLTYLVVPLFLLLYLMAEDIVLLFFGKNWFNSVEYFKYLCLFGMILPINTMHTNIIKALGKGKLYLFQQLLKRIIGLILILYSIKFGIKGVMISTIITGYVALIINIIITNTRLQYSILNQIKDILINILPNVIPFIVLYFFYIKTDYYITSITINTIIYLTVFLLTSLLAKNSSLVYLYKLLKK